MNSCLHILLIEDNPGDAFLIEEMLNQTGFCFDMKSVTRLSVAIALIKESDFDMILLDLNLPDSQGADTVRRIVETGLKAPIVVLTGLLNDEVGTEAVKVGAQDYLLKGQINGSSLIRSIRYALERKHSAEMILASAREWSVCFDAMSDGVSIHDVDHTILRANQSLFHLLGKSADEVIGKKCYQIFHSTTCPIVGCPITKARESFRKEYSEIFEPTIDKWLAVSASPILDDSGCLLKIVHTVRDITEQRKFEQNLRQSQKLESVGTLAGGIAHDFNNILTAIMGYGTIALMKLADGDPQRVYIQHILEAADRAASLTKDLLLFSRKQSADKMLLDMNAVVVKTGNFLKRVIDEDIIFISDLHETALPILANELQLEQVLMNMATNSNDAMPQGGTLTVTTTNFTMDKKFVASYGFGMPGPYVLLTVADSGVGMDTVTRHRIFEPFFTTKEVGKGTGMGLAIVYGIIKDHDGYITVYSEPGKGTKFSIYIPLFVKEKSGASRVLQVEAVMGKGETILLAEDAEIVRNLMSTVLKGAGYTVIEAVDGADAVLKFKENADSIQLLLFDLIMPKMNGKEAFDEIRKVRPEIKTIFASGYAPEIISQKVPLDQTSQMTHMIQKPVLPSELLKRVREMLDEG